MSNYYNLDGIKTALKKEIAEEKARLAMWENVKFPTKKDGTPFAVMNKNFDGATYYKPDFTMQTGENKLRVCEWVKDMGYISDEIDCYALVEYLKNPAYNCYDLEKVAKTQNYLPKQSYLKQVYKYDIDDIKKAVAARIEHKKAVVKALEKELTVADLAFNNFKTAYGNAMHQLEKDTLKGEYSFLYYAILETVKNRYPYC